MRRKLKFVEKTLVLALRFKRKENIMSAPLSDRLRPNTLDEMVGQTHMLGKGKLLRNIIDSETIPNLIFYGPSGVGKTTLAKILAQRTNRKLFKLNATTASTSDIKDIISQIDTFSAPNGILLYLDEIQYFNKKQQQTLLEFLENGKITLIASTTENPAFYIYSAILSRSVVFEFKSVPTDEIKKALSRAIRFLEDEEKININVDGKTISYIATLSGGDVRRAINFLELCNLSVAVENSSKTISLDIATQLNFSGNVRYDKAGEEYYDTLSAFQKSMRGSDPNAAIYYLARLLSSGDLISACRRLVVCACEDVGLAYPQIIPIVKSCVDIAMQVGLPEARIPLADAVIMVCLAPKSNSAYNAINEATADIASGKVFSFPRHLQNKHYDSSEVKQKGQFYLYPHDYPFHWVHQQYLPDELANKKYYFPDKNKNEQVFEDYWRKTKEKCFFGDD